VLDKHSAVRKREKSKRSKIINILSYIYQFHHHSKTGESYNYVVEQIQSLLTFP